MTSSAAAPLPATIADALRRDVVAARLAPGTAVTEAAVAVRFGCGRPTARTAIDRLVAAGVLERGAHRAARVRVLERADIVEIYDARLALEAAAIRALAETGAVPPAAVAANRALAATDEGSFAEDDVAFHRALVGGQPNARLARLHDGLLGEVELCIGQVDAGRLLGRREIAGQHQRILDAVVAGDPARAEREIVTHITGARDALLAHYDRIH